MDKGALAFRTEDVLRQLSKKNGKLLFTTHGFKLLGVVTWDRWLPDDSLGMKRRWIKGLVLENGRRLEPEERIFETSLQRLNQKTGRLEDVVAHEDDLVIIMERKTFNLSDDDENFQFMPYIHTMEEFKRAKDDIEAGHRRIRRLIDEKEQALLDTDFYKRNATVSAERASALDERVNTLTRQNVMLQDKIGNLEMLVMNLKSKNMQYEATVDETLGNATERGTILGMTPEDAILHHVEKHKEINSAMVDMVPMSGGVDESVYDDVDAMKEQMQQMVSFVEQATGKKFASQGQGKEQSIPQKEAKQ